MVTFFFWVAVFVIAHYADLSFIWISCHLDVESYAISQWLNTSCQVDRGFFMAGIVYVSLNENSEY